ncbi:MAG: hypothetical protein KZQ85_14430 [Candidatus Thiodiazotropha sp. (ex Myrtea sp. 'scaly one' KF741663)]|nr:hypothetical protein [Candidatus Thiodiazotropha sp. (ex Myrtea sp. 'scaly one' KF741663)]
MSLLDDLKKEADELKAAEDVDETQARLDADYRKRVRPAMLAILHYLSELTDQLKLVDPDVRQDYTLPGFGLVKGLHQDGYVVNADSTENTKTIRLRFSCKDEREREFSVKPKSEADETRDFLESQTMRYAEWPIRDPQQGVIGLNFQLTVKVDINFIFKVDMEQGAITLLVSNFHDFKVEKSVVQPERIDDAWLDNLGNYLLRRRRNLYELEIDDSDKAAIRQQLEAAKLQREAELEAAIQREREEQEEAQRNSLLGKLKSFARPGE